MPPERYGGLSQLALVPTGGRMPSTTPRAASLLLAVTLVRTDGSFPLTTVLPVAPAVPSSVHPLGLGHGERALS